MHGLKSIYSVTQTQKAPNWTRIMKKQGSPPAWTQEAYHSPRGRYTLCCFSWRYPPSWDLNGGGYPLPRSGQGHPLPRSGWGYPNPVFMVWVSHSWGTNLSRRMRVPPCHQDWMVISSLHRPRTGGYPCPDLGRGYPPPHLDLQRGYLPSRPGKGYSHWEGWQYPPYYLLLLIPMKTFQGLSVNPNFWILC